MDITKANIIFDKKYTNSYRDKYNAQCQCRECALFRSKFPNKYPEIVSLLFDFGLKVDYPLEIMDDGIDYGNLKRRYCVYYCVKGELPCDKIEESIEGLSITLRNWNIANEAYANTGMEIPFFTVEVSGLFIEDNEGLLFSAMESGREIEFHYKDRNYFISRNNMKDWYLYCEETKAKQTFSSVEDLLTKAEFENTNIKVVLDQIVVDYIL